jgi:hypothetical protein
MDRAFTHAPRYKDLALCHLLSIRCYPEVMRRLVAAYVAFSYLAISSGLALINCPFLSLSHSACCRGKVGPKKCPLSNSFETCPYVAPDSKVDPITTNTAGTAPSGMVFAFFLPDACTGTTPSTWKPALTDLHLRIHILLI